jgi:hypothetical protein
MKKDKNEKRDIHTVSDELGEFIEVDAKKLKLKEFQSDADKLVKNMHWFISKHAPAHVKAVPIEIEGENGVDKMEYAEFAAATAMRMLITLTLKGNEVGRNEPKGKEMNYIG